MAAENITARKKTFLRRVVILRKISLLDFVFEIEARISAFMTFYLQKVYINMAKKATINTTLTA